MLLRFNLAISNMIGMDCIRFINATEVPLQRALGYVSMVSLINCKVEAFFGFLVQISISFVVVPIVNRFSFCSSFGSAHLPTFLLFCLVSYFQIFVFIFFLVPVSFLNPRFFQIVFGNKTFSRKQLFEQ